MTIGGIFLGLALLIVVVAYVARPFWMPESIPVETEMTHKQALEAEKAVLLDEIRALDFDLETGKIRPNVHVEERAKLVAAAAEILKQLDQLEGELGDRVAGSDAESGATPAEETPSQLSVEAEIEAALTRIRQTRSASEAPEAEKVTVAVAAAPGGYCSHCGKGRDADDRFCAYCGHSF